MKKIISVLSSAVMLTSMLAMVPIAAHAAGPWYVSSTGSDVNNCLSLATACATVQGAVNLASPGDTITVAAGTYSGNIIIPTGLDNLTIAGAGIGSTIFNLGSGYGINLDNGYPITGFTLSGFTVNSSSGVTYAFKAYKADGATLTNDTFKGAGGGAHDGGVDINTTSNVTFNNVTSTGFYKNGFADTSAYTSADSSASGNNITFNNITATNNGWTGISFYTVGGDGGSASIGGVQFTGTNTISNNGAGIFLEGDSDANFATFANPANTITTDGATLNLTNAAFSGNTTYDIINYQTAPVNAIGATFGGQTGDEMNSSQRTAEDALIIDQLDHPNLGLVSYYDVPGVTTNAATAITTTGATLNGTNGGINADNTSFWWGASPAGPFSAMADPSSEFPAGWTHDGGLGSALANAPFSEPLTGLTPNTTYYFAAWSLVGGVWYPGAVLNFTTENGPLPSVITNSATGETTTGATVNGTDGSVNADNTSFWWGDTMPGGPITTPGSNPAATSEFPAGWTHDSGLGAVAAGGTFNEPLTGLTPATTYYYLAWVQVDGIWYPGQVLSFITPALLAACPAGTTQSASPVDSFIVNSSNSNPTPGKVDLTDGAPYIIVSSGTWQNSSLNVADSAFSSLNAWATYMEGYDTTPYFLGPQEFQMQVDGNFVNWGSYDGVSHTYSYLYTGDGSPVALGVFDGNSNGGPGAINTGWYGDNTGTLSVSVYSCGPTTGTLVVEKDTDGGNGTFNFSGSNGIGSFSITTTGDSTGGSGSQTLTNLTPGTYTVTESSATGWTQTDTDCSSVLVTAGETATCTVTNTKNSKLGEIRGTKFADVKGDGTLWDKYFYRLAGVTINLYDSTGKNLIASTVTNKLGEYRFKDLVAGTYVVGEVVPAGWTQTVPGGNGTYTVTLSSGHMLAKYKDFGNFKPWQCQAGGNSVQPNHNGNQGGNGDCDRGNNQGGNNSYNYSGYSFGGFNFGGFNFGGH